MVIRITIGNENRLNNFVRSEDQITNLFVAPPALTSLRLTCFKQLSNFFNCKNANPAIFFEIPKALDIKIISLKKFNNEIPAILIQVVLRQIQKA